MPSLIIPNKSLSKRDLPTALHAAKTQTYSDAPAPPTNARSLRGAPPPSSSPAATSQIRTLAWSPLGNLIATADARTLRVWNPERPGVRFSTELKPPASSSSQAAPPSVTAGTNGTAASTRPPPTQTAPAHLTGTERVAWNPAREAELASVGSDGTVRFWDVRTKGQCVGEVKVGGEGFSMAWRKGGEELVVGRKDDVLVPVSRRQLQVLAQYKQPVQTNQIAFSNSGNELFLTTGDSQVKILDYPTMSTIHTLNAHTSSCYTVTLDPRGRYLAIGGSDALLTLWDTRDFVCRHSLAGMTGPVRSVSFSFDGRYVVGGSEGSGAVPSVGGGGSDNDGLMIAHVETGEYVHTIETKAAASCVQWHPSRYHLAYAGEVGGGLKILGAATGA